MTRHALALAIAAGVAALCLAGCGGGTASRSATSRTATATATSTTSAPASDTTTGAATTTTVTTPPASDTTSSGVTYGMGDAPGWFAQCNLTAVACCSTPAGRCELSQVHGYFNSPRFLDLTTPSSAHRIREVRLFVEYDAAMEWNGSTDAPGCTYSRVLQGAWDDVYGVQPAGESLRDLITGVIEARADGLTPVVSIAGYPFSFARPAWDAPTPDPTTIAGYWGYRCGVQGILAALSRLPAWEQPHVFEPMNEPDGFSLLRSAAAPQATSCTPHETPAPDGAAKAACDEVIARQVIRGFAGHHDDTVLAGVFEHLDPTYLSAYASALARAYGGTESPDYPHEWSAHDYRDVDQAWNGPQANQLAAFDADLHTDTGGAARSLWITEAGTVLTSHVRAGDCPANGVDAAGTLGACLNGSPARQATAAAAFFALPTVATAVPITHLFWYQFQSAPYWDSGLLDTDGRPRAAWCVFYGRGECLGDPSAPAPSS